MKTTTIGRIGAIVTGAAMLGTAVASALAGAVTVDSGLNSGFFYDAGTPKVQVVVGEKAAASDGAVAGQIAALIGNMAFTTTSASASGGTVEVDGGTTTCTAGAVECAAGSANAEGSVTLSWEAVGLVGELQQKEMDCDIYDGDDQKLVNLTDGGDDGTYCQGQAWDGLSVTSEQYTPEDTLGTTLVGACETGAGADVSILKTDEFTNNICTICYNFCDIALGCEPHLMSEWVDIQCDNLELTYDCEEERLVLDVQDDAIIYNVFTDDILTGDMEDDDDNLVGQSYLGNILLGQHEYMVEDVTEDSITIVCGDLGTTTTSAPFEYTAPAEGSACDAGDSDQSYSLKLVGAQTIEEKGVVDVTLEITKPDGTTEQVTAGISGTPVVGDIKVKLQKGTAASNVITGEQSFSADLIVWYVPSEYSFDGDGSDNRYTEEGVVDDDGIWRIDFNGGDTLYAEDLGDGSDNLEDQEELTSGLELPDDIEENDHWEDCYEDASAADAADTEIIRFIQFSLEQESDSTELPAGDMIQLPFNDGLYLLSDLKFGYMGLMNEDFLAESMIDTTDIHVEIDALDVENDTGGGNYDTVELYREVTVDYVDEWGTALSDVRLDEGPFEAGDLVAVCDQVVSIDSIELSEGAGSEKEVLIEYSLKDGKTWTENEKTDDENEGDAINLSTDLTGPYDAVTVLSQVDGIAALDMGEGWQGPSGITGTDIWIVRNFTDNEDEDDWEIWIDKDDDNVMDLAETCDSRDATGACGCDDGSDLKTEFENDVEFCAYNWTILVSGTSDSGAEDVVTIGLKESENLTGAESLGTWNDTSIGFGGDVELNNTESNVSILRENCDELCDLDDADCRKIAGWTGNNREDGSLISLSGATIAVDHTEIEEPEDSNNDEETLSAVTLTIPEEELRPTIFFGIESALNTSEITITDADEGAVVNVGGVDVTVEDFGVTGAVSGGGVVSSGGEVSVQCPSVTGSCPDVSYDTMAPATIGYKLVVVDKEADQSKNLVLIGGPSVNSLTKDLTTSDEVCSAAMVKLVSANKLLVAGCEAADTKEAADALASWLSANV